MTLEGTAHVCGAPWRRRQTVGTQRYEKATLGTLLGRIHYNLALLLVIHAAKVTWKET